MDPAPLGPAETTLTAARVRASVATGLRRKIQTDRPRPLVRGRLAGGAGRTG